MALSLIFRRVPLGVSPRFPRPARSTVLHLVLAALAVGASLIQGLSPAPAAAQGTLRPLVQDARPLLDARLRFEHVEQDGFNEDARALTFRVRLGAESGAVAGFRFLVEGDMTRAVGVDDFYSGVVGGPGDPGAGDYPLVPDPDSERINRLHVIWEGVEGWSVVAGRQRIIHDNARFVGNVGFRQNEQSFDALRVRGSVGSGLGLDYGYLWQVNRILGSNSPAGTVGADTHLARVTAELPLGTLSGHAYLVGLEGGLVGLSNRTLGVRYTGVRDLTPGVVGGWAVGYSRQSEHGDNPSDFSLDYWELEGRLGVGEFTATAGLERLEGDGQRGFATPLATLHAFQGFADKFLVTPPDGIRDLNARVAYRWTELGRLGTLRVAAAHHTYKAQEAVAGSGRRDLGRELNLTMAAEPRPRLNVGVEFARYTAGDAVAESGPGGDTSKVWFTAGLALP